jgi:hypothetical protein
MNEISKEYNADQAKRAIEKSGNGVAISYDLNKFPVGRALCQKIDWYRSGKINSEEWDQISLKQVATDISTKKHVKIENYL